MTGANFGFIAARFTCTDKSLEWLLTIALILQQVPVMKRVLVVATPCRNLFVSKNFAISLLFDVGDSNGVDLTNDLR